MKTARSSRWAYFDTSAIVKRYVDEIGRGDVVQLLHRHRCVTSVVSAVELRSALRRRVSEGTIEAARVPGILRRVSADRAYWTMVEVGGDVLAAAETLVSGHPLRTLDAIHVASAQLFATRLMTPALMFVSADPRQTNVAAALGMTTRHIES